MRTSSAALALPTALLLSAPAGLSAQSPGAPGPDGFWRWALAEVRSGAGTVARSGPDGERRGSWERVRLGAVDITLDASRGRRDGRVGASDLEALLGDRALESLLARAGAGSTSSTSARFLNGRWQMRAGPPGARILQIRIVDRPLAEVNDLDGDGRVDVLLVYRGGGRQR